jgi:hypothetical protein
MRDTCPKGEIWRNSYKRTSKKTSKKTSVKGKCIPATSQTGKKTSIAMRHKLSKLKEGQKQSSKKYGTPKCKSGEIVREGYKRTSKSGKTVLVKAVCVKDVGKKGKQERLFYIEPERLSKYGYDSLETRSDTERHRALKDALASGEKPLSVYRRLIALSTLTKNTNPMLSEIMHNDAGWIQTTKEYRDRN